MNPGLINLSNLANLSNNLKKSVTNALLNNFKHNISRNLYSLPSPNECRRQLSKSIQDLVKDYSSVTNIDLQWGEQVIFFFLCL